MPIVMSDGTVHENEFQATLASTSDGIDDLEDLMRVTNKIKMNPDNLEQPSMWEAGEPFSQRIIDRRNPEDEAKDARFAVLEKNLKRARDDYLIAKYAGAPDDLVKEYDSKFMDSIRIQRKEFPETYRYNLGLVNSKNPTKLAVDGGFNDVAQAIEQAKQDEVTWQTLSAEQVPLPKPRPK